MDINNDKELFVDLSMYCSEGICCVVPKDQKNIKEYKNYYCMNSDKNIISNNLESLIKYYTHPSRIEEYSKDVELLKLQHELKDDQKKFRDHIVRLGIYSYPNIPDLEENVKNTYKFIELAANTYKLIFDQNFTEVLDLFCDNVIYLICEKLHKIIENEDQFSYDNREIYLKTNTKNIIKKELENVMNFFISFKNKMDNKFNDDHPEVLIPKWKEKIQTENKLKEKKMDRTHSKSPKKSPRVRKAPVKRKTPVIEKSASPKRRVRKAASPKKSPVKRRVRKVASPEKSVSPKKTPVKRRARNTASPQKTVSPKKSPVKRRARNAASPKATASPKKSPVKRRVRKAASPQKTVSPKKTPVKRRARNASPKATVSPKKSPVKRRARNAASPKATVSPKKSPVKRRARNAASPKATVSPKRSPVKRRVRKAVSASPKLSPIKRRVRKAASPKVKRSHSTSPLHLV